MKLATTGLRGDPMAILCTCSLNIPWKVKKVHLRQNSKRDMMLLVESGVLL